jgi:phosphate transport system substrate-binding protein
MLFVVIYILFDIVCGMFMMKNSSFLLNTTWSDAALVFAVCLYISIISIIFICYGFTLSSILKSWTSRVISVAPVALIGVIIWIVTYRSVVGATSNVDELPWIVFRLFTIWEAPVIEYLVYYVPGSTQMKWIALFLSFLPSISVLLGMWGLSYFQKRHLLKKLYIGIASLPCACIILFTACYLIPASGPFTLETYPRVDGATAAIPFGELLAHRLTGVNMPKAARSVRFNTSHNAYINLIEKKADIIFASGPSDEEIKLAERTGVKLKLTPIGKDAFIFLVHKDNVMNQIQISQLRDVYSGKVSNWKEIGGKDERIVAFQREENSGSQTFMLKKVMKDLPMASPPVEKKSGGMGGLIDAVADYNNADNAIGYSFYYFANEMHKSEAVKFLAVEGVAPNKHTIRNNEYPFTATLYAVTREDEPDGSPTNQLLHWILSNEGNKVIEAGGYVPVNGE